MAATETQYELQPQIHWGLDPVYSSYAKMYIKDVLEMPEYPQFQGAFAYKNHPILKVDVTGLIVKVVEKPSLFYLCVDDSTGVIGCTCWKPKDLGEPTSANAGCQSGDRESAKTSDILQELEELAEKSKPKRFNLGDFLHVRGRIKTFRGRREISASYYAKYEGAHGGNAEIVRMFELPNIYRSIYNKPFTLPERLAAEIEAIREEQISGLKTEGRLVQELMDRLQDFLKDRDIKTFSLQDLQTIPEFMDIARMPCREFHSRDASPEKVPAKQIHSIFKKAVEGMEETGIVFRKEGPEGLFAVVCQSENLENAILSILQRDSKKAKFAEKGCHYMHLMDCLRNTEQFRRIGLQTVLQALDRLECQSSIISCTRRHYIAFS
ncbi:CST complex subunit STN1-like [Ptychodera flava]|uniref:CST complex subunit STN1-like n=1 Tax=Ptychodera flava TaxID=63121 RepID=UPI00396A5571